METGRLGAEAADAVETTSDVVQRDLGGVGLVEVDPLAGGGVDRVWPHKPHVTGVAESCQAPPVGPSLGLLAHPDVAVDNERSEIDGASAIGTPSDRCLAEVPLIGGETRIQVGVDARPVGSR